MESCSEICNFFKSNARDTHLLIITQHMTGYNQYCLIPTIILFTLFPFLKKKGGEIMPGFDVETPDGDSSNGPRFSRDISRNTRDLPSLLCSCFPITLKFMNVCYQLKIENTSQKKKIEDREQAKKSAIFGFRHANTRSRFYLFLIYIYIYIYIFFFFFFFSAWPNTTLHGFSY